MRTRVLLLLALVAACTHVQIAPVTTPVALGPSRTVGHRTAKVQVTILSTMLVGDNDAGTGEWGFAALIEADGARFLVDTGARPQTVLQNAKELKIDLSNVADVVLTHAHDDHTGGLLTLRSELRKQNPTALGRAHVGADFFSVRVDYDGQEVSNAAFKKAYEDLGGTFVEHASAVELAPAVWFTGPVPRPHPEHNWSGLGKVHTSAGLVDDIVQEDSSIVIETDAGLVIITGCGHAGIVNIGEYATHITGTSRVHAVIGGLHLLKASDEQLAWTARKLRAMGVAFLIGAHCTGIEAVFRLRDALGLPRGAAVVGAVGATFTLDHGIDARSLAR